MKELEVPRVGSDPDLLIKGENLATIGRPDTDNGSLSLWKDTKGGYVSFKLVQRENRNVATVVINTMSAKEIAERILREFGGEGKKLLKQAAKKDTDFEGTWLQVFG